MAERGDDSVIQREPEVGYWLLYSRRDGVLLPARIWLCNHEPGDPENILDRWPIPFLAGEIGGKWVEPAEIWYRVLRRETEPNHWKCAHPIIPKEGLTLHQEFLFLMSEMAWLKENDRTHPLARPNKPVSLAALPLPF
jgi:hypothetical protein